MTAKYIKQIGVNIIGQETVTYVDTETGDIFPESLENRHYQVYLAWVAEGNTAAVQDVAAAVCEVN